MKHKFFKPALVLVAILAAGLSFQMITSDSVSGQDGKEATVVAAPESEAGAESWQIRCGEEGNIETPEKGKCEIFQRLSMKDTGQRVVEFAIGFGPEDKEARGIIILPLGILLESGGLLKIGDNEAFKFSPRYCDAGGCVAFLGMNEKILGMMRKNDKATLTIKAMNGQDINIELPLKGFGKAFKNIS